MVTLTSCGTILRMHTNKKTEEVVSLDLFNRITSDTGHVLYGLLPPKHNRVLRERGHDFVHLRVKREQFKWAFVNRCLFKFILYIFELKLF